MGRVTKVMFGVRLILCCGLAAGLLAQIQFPGSGGGRYPGSGRPGGVGGPFPGGSGRRGKNGDSTPSKGRKDNAAVTISTTGILRAVAGNEFVMEADDHRIITYKAGDKMTVLKDGKAAELSSFATADHLTVDSTADEQGYFTAVSVTFNKPGTPAEQEEASRTWDLPDLHTGIAKAATAINREDDDARPTLRRNNNPPPQTSASPEPAAGAAADADENRPTTLIRPNDPAPDADDPGKPQIRRGKPAPRAAATDTEPTTSGAARGRDKAAASPAPEAAPAPSLTATNGRRAPASTEPAPDGVPVQEDPIIVKAKEAAAVYAGALPNFFCRQLTTRFQSEHPKDGWQALDTISADLAYEDGHESYTNIKLGNKPQKSMEEVGGSWSTGEFASLLDDLFDPRTGATFRRGGADTIAGRSATTFKFDVSREHSHWRVMLASQLYYPAFRGTVWIDRETSRVLRLEMETRNMPLLFPLVKVEEAVDYNFVRLATAEPFLLPTVSEVLSCEQGSSRCTRNRIEFRNYRKFGAESGITFDEKQ